MGESSYFHFINIRRCFPKLVSKSTIGIIDESDFFLPSSGSVHILDGSEIRPVHQPLCFSHHCVPVRALHLLGSHVTDIIAEQESGTASAALLCYSCWDPVTG